MSLLFKSDYSRDGASIEIKVTNAKTWEQAWKAIEHAITVTVPKERKLYEQSKEFMEKDLAKTMSENPEGIKQ